MNEERKKRKEGRKEKYLDDAKEGWKERLNEERKKRKEGRKEGRKEKHLDDAKERRKG